MRILITGCCGYIGKSLSKYLFENNQKIFGIDRLETPPINILQNLENYACIDLCSSKIPEAIIDKVDIVIHLAGEASPLAKKNSAIRNNIFVTQNLISSINSKINKIVFLSSIKVGDASWYAKSKLESENILIQGAKEKNIPYTILRSASVYGNGMKSNITYWLRKACANEIKAIPSSKSELAMIGIKDLNKLIRSCSDNPSSNNKIYLVTDGISYSVNELELEARKLGNNPTSCIRYYPRWLLYAGSKFGDICEIFGFHLKLNSRLYNLFFENSVRHSPAIFDDLLVRPEQNFLNEMSELLKE